MAPVSILIASLCIFVRIQGIPLPLEEWEETPPPDGGLDPPSEDNEPSPKRIDVYYIGSVSGANQSPSDGMEYSSGNMESSGNMGTSGTIESYGNVEPSGNDGMEVGSNGQSSSDASNKRRIYTYVINGQGSYSDGSNGQRSYSDGNSDKKGILLELRKATERPPWNGGIDLSKDNQASSYRMGKDIKGFPVFLLSDNIGYSSDDVGSAGRGEIEDGSNGKKSDSRISMPLWIEERSAGLDAPSGDNQPPSNPIRMILIGLQQAAQASSNGKEPSSDNTKPSGYYIIEDISNGQRSYSDGNSEERDEDRINSIPLWIQEMKETPSSDGGVDPSSGEKQPSTNPLGMVLLGLPVGIQSLPENGESTGRDGKEDASNGKISGSDGAADGQGVVAALIKLDQSGANAAKTTQGGLNAALTASKTIPVLLF